MARRKFELKKIANRAARHVTFSKRRRGLIKKAQELSVLCEADVGLIIFSATGKLYEFASSSMKVILDKYLQIPHTITRSGQLNYEIDNIDMRELKQQIEDKSHVLSQMRGQNLESLSLKDLQLLEKKLENGLVRVRSRKDNSLVKEVDDLQKSKQEIQMREENANLLRQPVEIQDHAQSSESMCTSYRFNLNKASIQDYEPSDPLQLRLCLHSDIDSCMVTHQ